MAHVDPFEILGIAPRFGIDLGAVEKRHRDLSKTLHPDRHAGAPATERRMALSRAIDVNEAWRVVRDPARRAEALLRRAGVDVGETSQPKPPPALLMEMLEAREELAEAARSKDLPRVAALGDGMRTRQLDVERRLAEALDGAADRTSALPVLGELRYVQRFLAEVGAIEESLAP